MDGATSIYMVASDWKSQFSACLLLRCCGKIQFTSRNIKAIWKSAPGRSEEGVLIYKELSESIEERKKSPYQQQHDRVKADLVQGLLQVPGSLAQNEMLRLHLYVYKYTYIKIIKSQTQNNKLHFAGANSCRRRLLVVFLGLLVIAGCIIFHITCTVKYLCDRKLNPKQSGFYVLLQFITSGYSETTAFCSPEFLSLWCCMSLEGLNSLISTQLWEILRELTLSLFF